MKQELAETTENSLLPLFSPVKSRAQRKFVGEHDQPR